MGEGHNVHPDITKYGIDSHVPLSPMGGICPCINIDTGIVAPHFAADAQYIGRERLDVEFLWSDQTLVDHWLKGPHHVWTDVATGRIVRMWQPFNGLEVFDPLKWNETVDKSKLALPKTCKMLAKHCIQAFPNTTDRTELESSFGAIAQRIGTTFA